MKKIDLNKKYTTIAVYAFIVILLAVLAVFFFLNYSDFGGYISKLFSILASYANFKITIVKIGFIGVFLRKNGSYFYIVCFSVGLS